MSAACCARRRSKAAREKRARGEIGAEAFKAIEDREIEGVIRKQEAVGLKSITDGEYRRMSWNTDFLEQLDNVESYVGERKIKFSTERAAAAAAAAARHRQARRLQAASDDRAFQVPARRTPSKRRR